MKIDRIYLDCDGVLADFIRGAAELFGYPYSPEKWPAGKYDAADVFGVTEREFWATIHAAGSPFWESLENTPYAVDLTELATLFSVQLPTVVTCPSTDPTSYSGKAEWLIDRGWWLPDSAFFCADKAQLAASGRVLIDDNPLNCRQFSDAGGEAILFPAPWNDLRDVAVHGHVIGYIRSELERIAGRRFGNVQRVPVERIA